MTTVASVVVVIPYYNGSEFIERALSSVQAQTRPASEIIVVNDGSTEVESAFLIAVAKRYGASVIHQQNSGQSSARNAGVRQSRSTHICFLDQDDYFFPNHIAVLAEAIGNAPASGRCYSYGEVERVDLEGVTVDTNVARSQSVHPKRTLEDCVSEDMFILPSASMIPRALFDEVEGFEPTLRGYEDDDFFLRSFLAGYSGIFIDVPVVAWTLNPSSSSNSPEMAESRLHYLRRLTELLANRSDRDASVLENVVFPRFLFSFAFDVVFSRSVGVDCVRAEERFESARKAVTTSHVRIPLATKGLVALIAAFVALPECGKKGIARLLLARQLKSVRSRLWHWTLARPETRQ